MGAETRHRRRRDPCLAVITLLLACGGTPDRGPPGAEPGPAAAVEDLLGRADARLEERRYGEAAALYQEAQEVGPDEQPWRALYGELEARLRLGHQDDVAARLPELFRLAQDDPWALSRTFAAAAAVHHRAGDLVTAESDAERALDYARRAGDRGLESDALAKLGTVYSLAGRNREALELHEERVAAERDSGRGLGYLATALNDLAIDYRHVGRFEEALELYAEARQIFHSLGDPEGEAMVAYNTGNVYRTIGDDLEALELTRQALSLVEPLGSTYGLGLTHEGLGTSYLSGGNLTLARQHLRQALEVDRQAGQAYGEVGVLTHLGSLERQAGDTDLSLELLRESIELAERHGYGAELALASIELSLSEVAADHPAQGLESAERALSLAAEQGDAELELLARQARAQALEALEETVAALAAYESAIDLLESWRGRIELGDLTASVSDLHWGVYEGAIRCLFAEGRVEEAFEVSESARARLLLELMAERQSVEGDGDPVSQAKGRIREISAALVSASAERRPALRAELDELDGQLRSLEERLRAESPRRAGLLFPRPRSLEEIRGALITESRSILAYFWGDDEVYGWWISSGEVRGQALGESRVLAPQIDFLRRVLSDSGSDVDWRPAGRRAYRLLIEPLTPAPTPTLLVIPDGPLAYVPLESLIEPAGGRPLVADARIVYAPSASVLHALSSSEPGSGEGLRPRALVLAHSPRPSDDAELGPLPSANEEAKRLVQVFGRRGIEVLAGRRATRRRWLEADPAQFDVLHFATHAVVSDSHPERSRLVFAESSLDTTTIRRLHLHARLVTLSACETGLGRQVRGEGFVGLTHAFLAAGARAVVATVWRVGDPTTADFMQELYRLIGRGASVPEALQAVKREWVARGDERSHPARWAPYVLIGRP